MSTRSDDVDTDATFHVAPPSAVKASWPFAPGANADAGTGPRRRRTKLPPMSPPTAT